MSDDLKLAEQTVDTAIALVDRLMAENKQLRAENERLRQALRVLPFKGGFKE